MTPEQLADAIGHLQQFHGLPFGCDMYGYDPAKGREQWDVPADRAVAVGMGVERPRIVVFLRPSQEAG